MANLQTITVQFNPRQLAAIKKRIRRAQERSTAAFEKFLRQQPDGRALVARFRREVLRG